ncbi:MAG: hypothetical protein ACRDUS_17700 [Mycobacterium sp.]
MDRIVNPLFKAGMAAITATTLVVTPAVVPTAPQAISFPDIRSTPVRLSSLAFTPRVPDAARTALAALKFPLPPTATSVPLNPSRLAAITPPAPSTLTHAATAQSPATAGAPSRSGISAAAAGPVVANSITNGIDQAYQFIQYWVDYGVDVAQWASGWVPVIGGLVSAQIGIVYDNLVRPIANSFVYNLVDPIINDPSFSNIVNSFGRFGGDIVNSVINFAWAEARYFLPPLPPLPGFAVQATTDTVSTLPTSIHEALAPFTKTIKDAEAHIADTLGLTKVDHKLVSIEKPSTTAETTTTSDKDSAKEDGKGTAASVVADTKESKDKRSEKESAESQSSTKDKATGGTSKEQATKDKVTITEGAKDSPKETATSGAATGKEETSGATTEDTKPTKDTENGKDSGKDAKSPTGVVTKNKPKVPAASTTEHGAVSAQGTVRGSTSQSTTGKSHTDKSDSAGTTPNSGSASDAKTSDSKASDTKTPDKTKGSDTTSSGTKSSGAAAAHDSASKSSGSATSSSKTGGAGAKSGGNSHD